jgi:hypothetical protein
MGPVWVGTQYLLRCTCGNWDWSHPTEYIWLRELSKLHRELADQPS